MTLSIAVSLFAALLALGCLAWCSVLTAKFMRLEAAFRSASRTAPPASRPAPPPAAEPAPTRRVAAPPEAAAATPLAATPTPQEPPSHTSPRVEAVAAAPGPAAEPAAESGEARAANRWLRTISAGRHGAIGGAIGGIYLESADMVQLFREPENREEFARVAQVGFKARLERFASMQRGPAADFHHDWVEPDLLPILDGLSNLYARAVAEVRTGNPGAEPAAARLHDVIYRQLGHRCQEAGWFSIQVIVPFETDFDPIRHTAIGSSDASGAPNKVVDIRQAGRLDAVSGTVIAPAHVVVGR